MCPTPSGRARDRQHRQDVGARKEIPLGGADPEGDNHRRSERDVGGKTKWEDIVECAIERAGELGDDRPERPRSVEEGDEPGHSGIDRRFEREPVVEAEHGALEVKRFRGRA